MSQWVCRLGEIASNLKLIGLGWSVRLRVEELLRGLLAQGTGSKSSTTKMNKQTLKNYFR